MFYLNKLAHELDIKFVISSTWRFDPNHVKSLRDWGVEAEIIGQTPHIVREINGIQTAASREEEILSWIGSNSDLTKEEGFIIIDDEDGFDILSHRVLQTITERGMTQAKYEEALEKFKKKE